MICKYYFTQYKKLIRFSLDFIFKDSIDRFGVTDPRDYLINSFIQLIF